MEAPVCKMRRMTSVVVDQPGSNKILVDNVPDVSVSTDDVSCYMLTVAFVQL